MILDEWFDVFISRPIANRMATMFHAMGLSANQVTILATALGVGAGVSFASTGLWPVLGSFLLIGMVIVDCADGAVARMNPPSDKPWKGRMLDGYADSITIISVHIGIAVHLSHMEIIIGGYGVSGLEFALLSIAAFFSFTWNSSILDDVKQRLKPDSIDRHIEDYRDQPKTLFERFLYYSLVRYTASASKMAGPRRPGGYELFRQLAVTGPSHHLVAAGLCGIATLWAPSAFLDYLLLAIIPGNLYMWFIMARARRQHAGVEA